MIPGWLIYIYIGVFSLLIGSFINVCIYRLPLGKSIVYPSSHCTRCNSRLKPIDLVPVFSWLFYRGRCRYCKAGISFRYPFVEILTAALILLNYYFFGFSLKFLVNSVVSCVFVIITFIDYDYQIIPDELSVGGMIAAMFFQVCITILAPETGKSFYDVGLIGSVTGLLAGGGLLYAIAYVSRGGMGGGDIKLAAMLGALYGPGIVLQSLLLSFFFGGFIGILLILFRIKGRKDYIPFGPYICLATLTVLFATPEGITRFYLNLYPLVDGLLGGI